MTRILCFGDSITWGEADAEGGGWSDRLKNKIVNLQLEQTHQDIVHYNLGIAGETTDGLKLRFATEFKARMINGLANVVLLAYGMNDVVIHKEKNIVPESYFLANLKQAVQIAQQAKAKIFLLSITPIACASDGTLNQYGQLRYSEDIERYNHALSLLAKEHDCHYIDLYSEFIKHREFLLANDGLHPNSAGHLFLLQKVIDALGQECGILNHID